MLTLVMGSAASGKSEYAESLICGDEHRIYIATMIPYDQECDQRILRHRKMRAEKRFETVECYQDLKQLLLPAGVQVLLECLSNLVANQMFGGALPREKVATEIMAGIEHLHIQSSRLVIVSNDVFSSGENYSKEVEQYLGILGEINCLIAAKANLVVEVVAGIPVVRKETCL